MAARDSSRDEWIGVCQSAKEREDGQIITVAHKRRFQYTGDPGTQFSQQYIHIYQKECASNMVLYARSWST